jgi:anti-sigma regulatory factor (Ser/Thr protein kinase)
MLPPRPASACVARELVTWQLHDWDIDRFADDAAVIVTELVANAVRHAGTDVELRMNHIEGGVRLEVWDGSSLPLQPRVAEAVDEGGRGLLLVDALSTRHGVVDERGGKRIWVELTLVPA